MNFCGKQLNPVAFVFPQLNLPVLRFLPALVVAVLFVMALPARAVDADEWYLKVYGVIEQADALNTGGQAEQAKAKYVEAEKALKELKQNFPTYNPKLVATRLSYLSGKIATLSRPAPAPAGETSGYKPAVAAVRPVAPGQPQVKLLDAGAEPRQLLRLHPETGSKQSLVMILKMGMEMEIAQAPAPSMKIPAMKMDLTVDVKNVTPEGDIVYTVTYGDVGIEEEPGTMPEMVEGMKAALSTMKGLSAIGTNTAQGFNKGMRMNIPPGTDPQMRQVLSQMSDSLASIAAPLPAEAVGLGAKWETKMVIKSQGMSIDQTMVTELVDLDGDRATAKISMIQRAANQKVSNPSMPGLKLDLTKLNGSGQGESRLNLAQLLPTAATMNGRTEVVMGMNLGNQKQAMSMNMETQLTLKAK